MTPRARMFGILLAIYLALTIAVLVRSPVLRLDDWIADLTLRKDYSGLLSPVRALVDLGQRRPVAQFVVPILLLVAWRTRSSRPLVTLVVALVALNFSVGVVKLSTGRLGPRGGHAVGQIFSGGDIYPSGHVSNAVVMYGLVAMFVPARHRTKAAVAAGMVSFVVGVGTLYLKTHWFTDVVGGWLAGSLVLCSLPWLVPYAQRVVDRNFSRSRAAVSVVLGSLNLYVTLPLGVVFGGWVNDVFGGWLAAGLVLAVVPWLTPPLERRVGGAWRRLRDRFAERRHRGVVVVPPTDSAVVVDPKAARDRATVA
jgi:membrane-associated phospholipid phosphatase